jgi:hypothetical protein
MRFRPILFACFVVLLDCASLDPLASDTCGNGVVDAFEDCDSFPADQCGKPSDGAAACRLACGTVKTKDADGKDVDKMLTCPAGWGCSVNHICRQPDGTFQAALAPVSAGVTNLLVGDFDKDGRKDLVGTGTRSLSNASRVRVHFFDDTGGLAHIESLPSQFISPVVADIDHNGYDDIAFGLVQTVPGALGVMGGLPDRAFLPILFPSITIPDIQAVPLTVLPTMPDVPLPNGQPSAILLFGRGATGPALTSLDSETGAGGIQLRKELPVGPEAIRGFPQFARLFDADPTSTCGEIITAVDAPDGPSVLVFSPCMYGGEINGAKYSRWQQNIKKLVTTYSVPKPLGSHGALLADLNHDGHVDVIVDTMSGPYYALNSGTELGAFTATNGTVSPLAAADLNGDGMVDYVFPGGIFLSPKPALVGDAGGDAGAEETDAGAYVPAYTNPQSAWSDAVIGNFNGDGFPDVVTMRAGSPDLQVLAGSSFGAFTSYTVSTDNAVEHIARGDFDGDHVDDIVVSQVSSQVGSSDLAIAYGRAFGAPESARLIGRAVQPQGLGGIAGTGAVDDVGLFTWGAALPSGIRPTALTRLVGSGDRQTLAPLYFLDTNSPRAIKGSTVLSRAWFPLGLAAGAFTTPMRPEILAYAVGFTENTKTGMQEKGFLTGVWQASANDKSQGGLDAPKEDTAIDQFIQVIDPTSLAVTIATAAADIDNAPDGRAEVVVITNLPGDKNALVQVVRPSMTAPTMKPQDGLMLSGLTIAPGAQLGLVDVDGDGFRDAVAVFGKADAGQIMVFLNNGKGAFALPGIPVTLPDLSGDTAARAFAAITIGGAPVFGMGSATQALAVVTAKRVFRATLQADKKSFDVKDLTDHVPSGLISATGIASGDFNGDGVEDLAIADSGAVRLMLQVPTRSRP